MTEKIPLEAMIRRASRMAEEMFAAQGDVDMFWLVETASGSSTRSSTFILCWRTWMP